ncbi:MAG TPA: RNA 2',3'-cyclic phosphodiesterase [Candidatus Limnocylindria bacterium]|nr:RNA 2',3'-cyclic phosphodiesterase [Candidatus Limnocylindria bacterium]
MRLFIAIPLPSHVSARAASVLPDTLPGLRRVKPENLHVTLAFLGETPEDRLADAAAAAEEAGRAVKPFALRFDRAGRFPERGRPRVVWLGIADGRESVERLGEAVYRGLRERGLRFDDRPLAAHLTLARMQDDASLAEARTVAAALDELPVPRLEMPVDGIALVRSVLSPKGPRYSAVVTLPLAGPS